MGAAQDDLLARVDDLSGPSLLPRWTRAHVLTHVVGEAGSPRNLLDSARTGEAIPPEAGYGVRDRPPSFVELELGEPMRSRRADRLAWSR